MGVALTYDPKFWTRVLTHSHSSLSRFFHSLPQILGISLLGGRMKVSGKSPTSSGILC
jgi:hypothetical protein